MDLRLTDDEHAFATTCANGSAPRCRADIRAKCVLGQRLSREELKRWQKILHDKGWSTPAWSPAWGGTGWNAVQQYIFKEEMHKAPAPEPLSFNVNMIGPTLIAFGTEEQKRHFLPKISSLEYWFCQGFSEPGAGSDLASLRTSAVRDGDHYVLNGQKLWTSTAHHADWCFMLVRTDPQAKKQQGITYLLMDMRTPGITVRPIITLDGHHETNEMFLEDVRVPVANRLGEENKGWDYAKYLLGPRTQRHRSRRCFQDAVASCARTRAACPGRRRHACRRSALPRARRGDRGRTQGARDHADAAHRRDLEVGRFRQARSQGLDPETQGFRAATGSDRAAARGRGLRSIRVRWRLRARPARG